MRVTATDVYGDRLAVDHVIAVGRLGGTAKHRQTANVPPGGVAEFEVRVVDLHYVRVLADGYGKASASASGTQREVTVVVPVSSKYVTGFSWPDPMPEIPGIEMALDAAREDGARPWLLMTDVERGTVLNIWAKLWATPLGMSPAATFVEEVLEVRADRIIARVSHELLKALALAEDVGVVDIADSSLHEPPDGYTNGPSFKTLDERGNLQVSIFVPGAAGWDPRPPLLADIDIDESRGIAHVFDVIRHHATRKTTDPIEIHELLVHDGIDPGWKPLIA